MRKILITVLLHVLAIPLIHGATVNIDGSVEHQTMDGFGGAESWRLPAASLYPILFDDLGTSILRYQMFAYAESTPDLPGDQTRDNDNSDPFIIDWSGVAMGSINALAPLLQAAQSRGIKIIGTTWSPPAWMKENNLVESSGLFKAGYEDELVEFILIHVKGMQIYHGVHIDSVTIQNEPDSLPPWPGCKYTPAQITDIVKRLGARFATEGITTGIHAPDMTRLSTFLTYANSICADPVAKSYVRELATHPYGSEFKPVDTEIPEWISAANLAAGCGKKLWQTEFGGKGPSWNFLDDAFLLVQYLHNALVHGNVSAWLCYELYKTGGGGGGVITDTGYYPRFYALKQYYRYVRPGAIRVDAQPSSTNILVTAFNHKTNNTFTVVAINRMAADESTDFSIGGIEGLSGLDVIRTSATENSTNLGQIAVLDSAFTYLLPSNSITTFTGSYVAPADRIEFLGVMVSNRHVNMCLDGPAGSGIQIQYANALAQFPDWMPLTNLALPDDPLWFTDILPSTVSNRFYRALEQ